MKMLNKAPFKVAKIQALKSSSRFRVGCVLAKGNRIISTGINDMSKTHPITKGYDEHIRLHAEANACIGLRPYDVRGCIAYIYRALANEKPALAKPCNMCRAILKKMGIKKAYYTIKEFPFWDCEEIGQ